MPKRKKTIWQIRKERIAQSAHSAQKPSYRYTQRFWTDLLNPADFELAELIETLKDMGEFANTVKRGIHLVASLDTGRMDVLLEMFPWVKSKILKSVEELLDRKTQELQTQINDLQQQLARASVEYQPPKQTTKRVTINESDLFTNEDTANNADMWETLADNMEWQ